MRIHGTLTEDEVDQIILKHLQEEYNIRTGGMGAKHHVELKWVRGQIEFFVTDPLAKDNTSEFDFTINPGGNNGR